MVVYCVGDVAAKRADFRKKQSGKLSIDNDEVLGTIKKDGKVYFAVGTVPFSNMRVYEYVAYCKALTSSAVSRNETKYYRQLFKLPIPLKSKMKKLSVPQYRMAQLLGSFSPSVTDIYVNMDGVEYSVRHEAEIKRLVAGIGKHYRVFVSVSDYRFIPEKSRVKRYDGNGDSIEISISEYVCGRANKKALTVAGQDDNEAEQLRPKKVTCACE